MRRRGVAAAIMARAREATKVETFAAAARAWEGGDIFTLPKSVIGVSSISSADSYGKVLSVDVGVW